MASKKGKVAISVAVIAVIAYIGYRYVTKPKNASPNTNSKAVLPGGGQTRTGSGQSVVSGQYAVTNKSGVHIRRNPGVESFLGLGILDNTDEVIPNPGTNLGKISGYFSDASGDSTVQWIKLNKVSTAFMHSGDPLYVNSLDVSLTDTPTNTNVATV